MRDFFRGERDSDRDPWRESERVESRYGRGESERHSRFSQERDWDDEDTDRERGRYGSYSGGVENPRFYGQSGRSDWRESDYGRERGFSSRGGYGSRDWGLRDYDTRQQGGGPRGYGGRDYGGGFQGAQTEPYEEGGHGEWSGRGTQYGSGAGRDWYRSREEGGGGFSGRSGTFRGRGPRGYQRSDERIREDVCECLTDDPMIDASNMEVTVKGGEVTLSGTVSSRDQKRRAMDLVEDISGVKDVHNNLRVESGLSGGVQEAGQQSLGTQAGQAHAGQTQPRH